MNIERFKKEILPLKDKLYRLARRILNNPAEAEDAVQEVMIKVWQKRDELAAIQNIEAWLIRLTRNQSIDLVRSRRKNQQDLEVIQQLPDKRMDIHQEVATKNQVDLIKKSINQLPETQRMILQLREIEGFSYQEIADLLDISISQVKVQIFRARKLLKSILFKKYEYEK